MANFDLEQYRELNDDKAVGFYNFIKPLTQQGDNWYYEDLWIAGAVILATFIFIVIYSNMADAKAKKILEATEAQRKRAARAGRKAIRTADLDLRDTVYKFEE